MGVSRNWGSHFELLLERDPIILGLGSTLGVPDS